MKHAQSSSSSTSSAVNSSSSSSAVAGATWWMLKLLTSAGQRPAGPRLLRPEDGYLQLVRLIKRLCRIFVWIMHWFV